MEVYFKRNLLQSYMVIGDSCYGGYDMTMLNRNRLPGFFAVKMVEADGTWQYWYEITGLQMLDEYMKQKAVDYALLKKIVLQIDACLELAAEYLLLQENISMQTERIGIRPETGQLYFCYHRGENVEPERQFQNLIEQILPNVDHKDRRAVEAIYAIYEIVLADHFDYSDVKKVFAEIPEMTEDTVSMVAEDIEYRQEEPEEKPESAKISIDNRKESRYSGIEKKTVELTEEEKQVIACVSSEPKLADDILAELDMPAGKVLSILTRLSIKGCVKTHPGKLFSLTEAYQS